MGGAFEGVNAIVTGGGSGLGAAIVTRLRRDGARVAVFDLQPSSGVDEDFYIVDVTDDSTVMEAVARFASVGGGIDILVNNAGIGALGSVEDNADDEWSRVLDVNLLGAVRVSRAALPWLRKSAHAAIVNVASIAATVGLPQRALYGASKGAILALTMHMAADHVHEGIRVNAVSPGTIDTPWVGRLLAAAADPVFERAQLNARQPHGRLITAEEVADGVVYLAGRGAGSTTGANLAIDGGMSGLRLRL